MHFSKAIRISSLTFSLSTISGISLSFSRPFSDQHGTNLTAWSFAYYAVLYQKKLEK
jgi:hypothetical protein